MRSNLYLKVFVAALALGGLPLAVVAKTKAVAKSPTEILAEAPMKDWREIAPDDIVITTLSDGTSFVYELASDIAPRHVANIKKMIRSGFFDKAAIIRVQDNYVVQWGYADDRAPPSEVEKTVPAEYEWAIKSKPFKAIQYRDSFGVAAGYTGTWPSAHDGKKRLAHPLLRHDRCGA